MEKPRSLDELKQFLKECYKAHDQIERLFYPEHPLPLAECYLDLGLIKEKVLKAERDSPINSAESKDNQNKDLSVREHFLRDYERIQHIRRKLDVKAILQECKAAKKRIYIEGAAGAGKSTLSRFIANEWAYDKAPWNQYDWVFFIRLRDLDLMKHSADKALLSVIDNELFAGHGNHLSSLEYEQLNTDLIKNKDKVLWILDGYDELNLDIARCNWWNDLIKSAYSMLVTSRPGAQLPKYDLAINLNLAVLGFSDEQVNKYVTNFFDARFTPDTQPEDAAKYLALLKGNANLWSLAHTPIQLELLCSSWQDFASQPDLPLTQLYRVILERLLKRRAISEGLILEESDPKVLHSRYADHLAYMEYLAFLGMQLQQIVLTEQHINQAYKILSPEKHKQANFYKELKALGLVKRYNNGKHAEFIHLTFQEFFAARYVAKAIKAFSQGKSHSLAGDDLLDFMAKTKWNNFYEVMWWFVAGLLGGKPNAQKGIETYRLKDDDNQDLEFTIPKSHQRLQNLQAFFDLLLQEPRAELEAFELPLLAKCYAEAGAPNIMQKDAIKLHFQSWLRFYWAKEYAYKLQGSAIQKLVEIVKSSPLLIDWVEAVCLEFFKNSKETFIRAIGSLGLATNTVLQKGLLVLLQDKEEGVRTSAAQAVGALGPAANADLQHGLLVLLQDKEEGVRTSAAQAVGALGPAANADLQHGLLPLLRAYDSSTRAMATKAVRALGPTANIALQQVLLPLLHDPWVRDEAAQAVGALGPAANADLQREILLLLQDKDRDDFTRRGAFKAVKALGLAANADLQREILLLLQDKDQDAWVRQNAAEAVGALGLVTNAASQKGLLALLQVKEKYVRITAIKALGSNPNEALQQALLTLLHDEDMYVREAAVKAVMALGPAANADLQREISLLLQDKEARVRQATVQAVGALGQAANDDLQRKILWLLHNEDPDVREVALKAVKALGPAANADLQREISLLLQDKEARVRKAAIKALVSNPNEALQQALLTLLHDEDMYVREAAIHAVGNLGPAANADLQREILLILQDKKQSVRTAAIRAVGNLGPAAIDILLQGVLAALKEGNLSKLSSKYDFMKYYLLPLALERVTDEHYTEIAPATLAKTRAGLGLLCQEIFKDRPCYIPPSRLIFGAKGTVQVNGRGELVDCLKLCGTVLQNMFRDGNSHNLTHEHWTLAMVRRKPTHHSDEKNDKKKLKKNTKKSSLFFESIKELMSHAFFIIEGVKEGVRFAQKIDLYALESVNNSQSRGQKITIDVTDITDFSRLQQLAENSYCMVQGVSKEKIEMLMQLINEDQAKAERKEIVYNKTGDGSAALGQAKQHSCVSWCLEKWQQIGLPLKRKWYDPIVVVAPAYLPEPKEKKDCLVM